MTYVPIESVPFFLDFLDSANAFQSVGDTLQDGYVQVEFTAATATDQTGYVVTFGASPTGVGGVVDGPDILRVPSDNPLATVEVAAVAVGTDIRVTFTGSGPGDPVEVRGTIKRIARN